MAEDKLKNEEAVSSKEEKQAKKKKAATSKSKENKKIRALEEKVAALEQESAQLKDQLLRKMAEFENYRRRTEKEFLAHLENATEGLITELLPVLDDFERFLEHAANDETNASLKDGVELIYKKFKDTLSKKGLKPMESVGQEFDAEKHQALLQADSDEHESGFVTAEHLKGYLLNDKVIRHAQVIVAK